MTLDVESDSHPDQYLTVPPFHPTLQISQILWPKLCVLLDSPGIWNDLPNNVCNAKSITSFRKKIKTYLFGKSYPP